MVTPSGVRKPAQAAVPSGARCPPDQVVSGGAPGAFVSGGLVEVPDPRDVGFSCLGAPAAIHVVATTSVGRDGGVTQSLVQLDRPGTVKWALQEPLASTINRPTGTGCGDSADWVQTT